MGISTIVALWHLCFCFDNTGFTALTSLSRKPIIIMLSTNDNKLGGWLHLHITHTIAYRIQDKNGIFWNWTILLSNPKIERFEIVCYQISCSIHCPLVSYNLTSWFSKGNSFLVISSYCIGVNFCKIKSQREYCVVHIWNCA